MSPEPAADLSAYQRDLLAAVSGLDYPSGPAIKEVLERYYDREITDDQHYPALDELVERGLAGKGEIDAHTNYYALTEAGQETVESDLEWRRQLVEL